MDKLMRVIKINPKDMTITETYINDNVTDVFRILNAFDFSVYNIDEHNRLLINPDYIFGNIKYTFEYKKIIWLSECLIIGKRYTDTTLTLEEVKSEIKFFELKDI